MLGALFLHGPQLIRKAVDIFALHIDAAAKIRKLLLQGQELGCAFLRRAQGFRCLLFEGLRLSPHALEGLISRLGFLFASHQGDFILGGGLVHLFIFHP